MQTEVHGDALLAGRAASADEARWWGGHAVLLPVDPGVFLAWHADPDVRPYVLREDGVLLAYGEVPVGDDEQEVELGRIIVRPLRRGQGVGRIVVSLLLDQATQTGYRSASSSLPLAFVHRPLLHRYAGGTKRWVAATAAQREGTRPPQERRERERHGCTRAGSRWPVHKTPSAWPLGS